VRPRRRGRHLHRSAAAARTLPTLWGDDDRFEASYLCEHPGYYLTGDGGYLDDDGYLFVMGRIDDVINVAGHRLSTGSIEAVLAAHPAVAECAVIGVADEIKGQVPRGLVVLKAGASDEGLAEQLVAAVRDEIGAWRASSWSMWCPRCRRRARARFLRKTMRGIATARTSRCPRPSRIRRCWTHSGRFCGLGGFPQTGIHPQAHPAGDQCRGADI